VVALVLQGLRPLDDAAAPTERDPAMDSKDPEDIPTFDEWKRKMMEEVEKEQSETRGHFFFVSWLGFARRSIMKYL